MTKRDEIKHLFTAGFDENSEWTDWYFDKVYDDDEAMIAYSSSKAVSCLMLSQYRMKLGDASVGMGYISCATTARSARGQGHMRRLINDALMESACRGDALVALIPASRRLYLYYARLGFVTLFYTDNLRYTSLHRFCSDSNFERCEPSYSIFSRLEALRLSTVIHSEADFSHIIEDAALDGSHVLAVADRSNPDDCAMAFVTIGDDTATVKDISASSARARENVLAEVRKVVGPRMIVIRDCPGDDTLAFTPAGMGRIASVKTLLEAIAAHDTSATQTIRVRDNIIADNNAVFIIHNGTVESVKTTMRKLTINVSVENLAKIIFNSPRVGQIFSIPSFRPYMALMLE